MQLHFQTPAPERYFALRRRNAWFIWWVKCAVISLMAAHPGWTQGIPFTINYQKTAYGGGTQNWAFCQDADGIVYVANNEGLLEFDGRRWNIFPVDNKTIVRSLAMEGGHRIWVGAQNEFGYFEPDANGTMHYQSLRPIVQQSPVADVWKIAIAADSTVLFQTSQLIFGVKGNRLEQYVPPSTILYFGKTGHKILAQDVRAGLLEWNEQDSFSLANPLFPGFGIISSILPWHQDTLLITTQHGSMWKLAGDALVPWKTEADDFLRRNRIYTAAMLADGRPALGTSQGGIAILNRQGLPDIILNKKNGLQNNGILSLFTDRQGNLWAGTENGLDIVLVNSPFSFLLPDGELEGSAYSAYLDEKVAYFATNNGLYYTPMAAGKNLANNLFTLVQHTQGQVWNISKVNQELLVAHHVGPYRLISPTQAEQIGKFTGAWNFLSFEGHEELTLAGAYNGLNLLRHHNGSWQTVKKYDKPQESCRILALENPHLLWVAHPYRGIYRVAFSEDYLDAKVNFFDKHNGLPSNNRNLVFKIGNEIVFATEKGILKYDEIKGSFEPYPLLNEIFPEGDRVKLLREGIDGEIWFQAGEEVGYLEVEDHTPFKKYKKQLLPFLKGKLLGGFEFILPYDRHHVIFGTDRGFILYDKTTPVFRPEGVLLRQIALSSPRDSVLLTERGHHFLNASDAPAQIFHPKENSLKFVFALPVFGGQEPIEYAYSLEGLDEEWSDWSERTEKEYANLRPGSYSFQVKARFSEGDETLPTIYRFEITSPWYAGKVAYFFYFLLVAGFLTYLLIAPKKRYEREKEFLTNEHQRKEADHRRMTEAAQRELDRVRQEKLITEIDYKNKELASTTLHLLQKGEILHKIQEDIQRIARHCQEPETRKNLLSLTKVLAQDAQLDADWAQFAQHFDQVHSEFLRRLRDSYPELTPRDQKLCAYLRMNLSSKEIAPLLNISVRGVEISRYRLRKKLNLDTEVNLTDFLLNF